MKEHLGERFWSKVKKTGTCWLWTASTNDRGYGTFHLDGGPVLAHIAAYRECVGEIPAGLELDHTCRNQPCVNPAHLEPVTHRENMRRADMGRPFKSHCARGHAYDGWRKDGRGQYWRTCVRLDMRASRARRKNTNTKTETHSASAGVLAN